MAIIPIRPIILSKSLEINPAAVASGAGESARASLPREPINYIFKSKYTITTIPMTIFKDL
jgi:hypothetical protein